MDLKINKTATSRIICAYLAGCNPVSQTTNIETFKEFLSQKFTIKDEDFYKTFDDLEECGAGYFTSAQPHVFVWAYNLKEVAQAITYPGRHIKPTLNEPDAPRAPRRTIIKPLTTTMREVLEAKSPNPSETKVELQPAGASMAPLNLTKENPMTPVPKKKGRPFGAKTKNRSIPKEIIKVQKEVLMALRTKSGRLITITIDDADDLIKQVQQIKSELHA